jgi:hypothetical protein
MQVFLFQSQKDTDVAGFTTHKDGDNLPIEFAPWKQLGSSVMQVGMSLAGVIGGSDAVLDGIRNNGYYLARSEVKIQKLTMPRYR